MRYPRAPETLRRLLRCEVHVSHGLMSSGRACEDGWWTTRTRVRVMRFALAGFVFCLVPSVADADRVTVNATVLEGTRHCHTLWIAGFQGTPLGPQTPSSTEPTPGCAASGEGWPGEADFWRLRRGGPREKQPDETFIGCAAKGLDVLGYRLSPAGLSVAKPNAGTIRATCGPASRARVRRGKPLRCAWAVRPKLAAVGEGRSGWIGGCGLGRSRRPGGSRGGRRVPAITGQRRAASALTCPQLSYQAPCDTWACARHTATPSSRTRRS